MLTKDSAKWNFEMLQELIEGPLLNPKRLEEAIKVARFMRRLLSFFHPFTHRFSDLPRKQVFYCLIPDHQLIVNCKPNVRWVRLGCSLLTTLLASPDGIRFLASEDDLLKQIVKCFAQLDPVCFFRVDSAIFLMLACLAVQRHIRIRPYVLKVQAIGDVDLWIL